MATVASYGAIQLMSGETPLVLQELKISTVIVSGTSESTIEMNFLNTVNRDVEGELDFPLPENAIVCGYAYDFQGRMVPASVVEKEQARVTFEKEVRAGNSTSLVEHVKGNSFKVRVYPIPASSTKRVRLQFTSELSLSDKSLHFSLPFVVASPLQKLSISIEIQKSKEKPTLHSNVPNLDFSHKGDVFKASASHANITLDKLSIDIPQGTSPGEVLVAEKDWAYKGMESFFVINDIFDGKDMPSSSLSNQSGKIGVIWDASYSFVNIDRTKEFELIASLCKDVKSIDLVLFSNTIETPQTFSNVESLLKYLKNEVIYDGGTDMEHLQFPNGNIHQLESELKYNKGDYSKFLLFTDGLSTLSGDLPSQVPKVPVFVFVNNIKNNLKSLKRLASKSGGLCFNITNTKQIDSIASEVNKANICSVSVSFKKEEVGDVLPAQSIVVVPGQRVQVVGKLLGDSAQISLNFIQSGATKTRSFTLKKTDSLGVSDLIPRMWAQQKVDDLAALDTKESKKEMLKIGRRFGIVTPNASLLVLTTLDQYLQHHIKPSKDALPDIFDQYVQRRTNAKTDEQGKRKAKISKVLEWWDSRISWWNTEYTTKEKYEAVWKQTHPSQYTMDPPSLPDRPTKKHTAGLTEKDAKNIAKKKEKEKKEKPKKKENEQTQLEDAPPMERYSESASDSLVASYGSAATMSNYSAPQSSLSLPEEGMFESETKKKSKKKSMKFDEEERKDEDSSDSFVDGDGLSLTGKTASVGGATIGVSLKTWSPDTPYLNAIKAVPTNEQYKVYLKQRKDNQESPAFFLDCATYFFEHDQKIGLKIVTSITDMKLEDPRLLRIVAYKLFQEKVYDQSIWLFNLVVKLRGEEPQSYRDLALVYAESGNFQKAIDLFYKVVTDEWELRFQHIEDEVLMEMNRTIWKATKNNVKVDTSAIEPKFLKHLPVDVKLTIAWDTDDTCMDLHIIEPNGEKCFYGNHVTAIGGWSTPDYSGCTAYSTSMLREYLIKFGLPGKYTLSTNYYSNFKQDLTGATTIWFTIFTNYGTDREEKQTTTIRLRENSASPTSESEYEVGSVVYGTSPTITQWEKEFQQRYDALTKKWSEYNEKKIAIDREWEAWNKEEQAILAANETLIHKFLKH